MRAPLALAALAWLLATAPAAASMFCGGRHVEQRGQQVILTQAGDEVTATYGIAFETAAPDVAWVLPVPSRPTVALAERERFQDLGLRTQPIHRLREGAQELRGHNLGSIALLVWLPLLVLVWAAGAGGAAVVGLVALVGLLAVIVTPSFVGGSGPKADVFAAGRLGPYETATLRASSPAALTGWLRAHGYVVPARAEPALAPYVAAGAYFVALRLRPGEGEPIRDPFARDPRAAPALRAATPVTLRYRAKDLTLPLRLASLSAARGMPLTVWIEGPARAVSPNYPGVVPNPARIAWHQRGRNYRDVVAAAVREAGGRGFVTDFARPGYGLNAEYLTRMVTAIDPEAMTEDPRFTFVAGLPEVQRATANPVAAADGLAPFAGTGARWVTADATLGFRFAREGGDPLPALPALWRTERLGADGRLQVDLDRTAAIRAVVDHTAVAIDRDGVARAAGPVYAPWTRPFGIALGLAVPVLGLLAMLRAGTRRAVVAASPKAAAALTICLVAATLLGV